ncbi:hypothetical protein GUITHDRAFT_109026 [Guillardia theta CCMP2712]|uniref:Uncharacterized protein n=1 Tax=Guillardia theta (strain CCMP2712) TaxID=905079 RepID=L1JA66_GUITC|nr:hypothetical protein GUITHDRAFT_109026 [Guillardia theta CCMP2712]EKX44980.1 hypothetical protein GUITHDRAFT_109026 [Guillardia theta CCMP2712]|mmetsp:Transcript_41892/g.132085  ORF Transcript_41892/g.132085 Transcript_41892/m.132085 type:complete len:183 (-) Transcript_41892:103-651(-)|eukprot:XP_005831960.1 hypothetical protein GUITHDRAFT_109026 [Guillardia theta CCMP2712]
MSKPVSVIKGKATSKDLLEMEEKLRSLKQSMEEERKKRSALVQRNGTGSVWINGRAGALRGANSVKEFVKSSKKLSATVAAIPFSAVDAVKLSSTVALCESSASRASTASPTEQNQNTFENDDNLSNRHQRPISARIETQAIECQTESPTPRPQTSNARPSTAGSRTYFAKIMQARQKSKGF